MILSIRNRLDRRLWFILQQFHASDWLFCPHAEKHAKRRYVIARGRGSYFD